MRGIKGGGRDTVHTNKSDKSYLKANTSVTIHSTNRPTRRGRKRRKKKKRGKKQKNKTKKHNLL